MKLRVHHWFYWLPGMLLLLLSPGLSAEELQSTLDQQQSLAVTIDNSDLALAKDTRAVQLRARYNDLAFKDVSARIRPETAIL